MTEQVEPWTPADIAIATALYAATGGTGPVAGDDPLVQLFTRFRRQNTEPLVARIEALEAGLVGLATKGEGCLASIDAHNEKHGTFWVGPGFLQLGVSIAAARGLLEKTP